MFNGVQVLWSFSALKDCYCCCRPIYSSSSSITINVKTTTTRTLYNSFSNYKPMNVNEIGDVSMAGTWGTASGRAVCPKGAAAHSGPLYFLNSRRRLYLESTTYYLIATLLQTRRRLSHGMCQRLGSKYSDWMYYM